MTRWIPILATCVVTALCLTACGSSSSSSSASSSTPASTPSTPASTPSTPAAAATSTATGAPIVLGSICSCSGVQAAALGGSGGVATAWAKSVNATGGINGHPVKLIVEDDGGNPATSLQDAKTLIEQDHVMAIVSDVSTADASFATYVASKDIPVVGGLPVESTFLTSPDFFASGTTAAIGTFGTLALGKSAGASNIGIEYCAESPVCAQIVPLATGESKLLGLKVSPAKISSTAPSYAAPCLAAKSAGATAAYVIAAAPVVQRFFDGCAQEGYKVLFAGSENSTAYAWLKDPAFAGALLAGSDANPFDASTPAIAQYQAALKKYDPGVLGSTQFDAVDLYPWVAGKLFEAAAKAAHIGPTSTGADVKKGLYALKNETLGGLAPPLTYVAGKPANIGCYFSVKIANGSYTSLNADKPTCLTATQGAELGKALG